MPSEIFKVDFKVDTSELKKLETKLQGISKGQNKVVQSLGRRADIYNKGLQAIGQKSVEISNRSIEGQNRLGQAIEKNMQKRRVALTAQTSIQSKILSFGNAEIDIENRLTAAKEKNAIASGKKLQKEKEFLDTQRKIMINEKRKGIRVQRKADIASELALLDSSYRTTSKLAGSSNRAENGEYNRALSQITKSTKESARLIGLGNRVSTKDAYVTDDEVRNAHKKSKTFGTKKSLGAKAEGALVEELLANRHSLNAAVQKEAELKKAIQGMDKGLVGLKKDQTEAQKKTNLLSKQNAKIETDRISQLKDSGKTRKERNILEKALVKEGEKISKNATKLLKQRKTLAEHAQKEGLSLKAQNALQQALIKNGDKLQQIAEQTNTINRKRGNLQKQELKHAQDLERVHRKDTEAIREKNRLERNNIDRMGDKGSDEKSTTHMAVSNLSKLHKKMKSVKDETKKTEKLIGSINKRIVQAGVSEKRVEELMRSKNKLQSKLISMKRTEGSLNKNISRVLERQGAAYKKMQQNFTQFRQIFFTGAIIAGAGLGALSKVVKDAGDEEKAIKALNRQARLSNIFGSRVGDTVKNLDIVQQGLVSIADTSKAIRNLMRLGFSFDEAIKSTKQITEIAIENKQSALSLGQAIVSTTEGFRQELSVLADAGGITKNLSVIYEEFAVTLGKTGKELNRSEKNMALMHEISLEATLSAGALDTVMNTLSGSVDATGGSITILSQNIGESLTPAITNFLKKVIAVAQWTTEFVKNNSRVLGFLGEVIGMVVALASGIGLTALALKGALGIGAGLIGMYGSLAAAFSTFSTAVATGGVAAATMGAIVTGLTGPFGVFLAVLTLVSGALYLMGGASQQASMTIGELINKSEDLTQELALSTEKMTEFKEALDDIPDGTTTGLDKLKHKMSSFGIVQENVFLQLRLDAVKTKKEMSDFWNTTNDLMRENLMLSAKLTVPEMQAKLKQIASNSGTLKGANAKVYAGNLIGGMGTTAKKKGNFDSDKDYGKVVHEDKIKKLANSLEGVNLTDDKAIFKAFTDTFTDNEMSSLGFKGTAGGYKRTGRASGYQSATTFEQSDSFIRLVESLRNEQYSKDNKQAAELSKAIDATKKVAKGFASDAIKKNLDFSISNKSLKTTDKQIGSGVLPALDGQQQALFQLKQIIEATEAALKGTGDKGEANIKRKEGLTKMIALYKRGEKAIQNGETFTFGFTAGKGNKDIQTSTLLNTILELVGGDAQNVDKVVETISLISIKLKKSYGEIKKAVDKARAKNYKEYVKTLGQLSDKSLILNAPMQSLTNKDAITTLGKLAEGMDSKKIDADILRPRSGEGGVAASDLVKFEKDLKVRIFVRETYNEIIMESITKLEKVYKQERRIARMLPKKADKITAYKAAAVKYSEDLAKLQEGIGNKKLVTTTTSQAMTDSMYEAQSEAKKITYDKIVLQNKAERMALMKQINNLTNTDIKTKTLRLELQKQVLELDKAELVTLKLSDNVNDEKLQKAIDRKEADIKGMQVAIEQQTHRLALDTFKKGTLDAGIVRLKQLKRSALSNLDYLKEVAALEAKIREKSEGDPSKEKSARSFLEGTRRSRTFTVRKDLSPAFGIQGKLRQMQEEKEAHKALFEAKLETETEYKERVGALDLNLHAERRRLEQETTLQLKQSFVDSYMGIIDGTKSFGDLLYDVFKTMADRINKMMIEQAIEQSFMGAIFESIAGGISTGGGSSNYDHSYVSSQPGSRSSDYTSLPSGRSARSTQSSAPVYNINMKIDAVDGASLRRVFQSPEAQQSIASTVMVTSQKNKIPLGT